MKLYSSKSNGPGWSRGCACKAFAEMGDLVAGDGGLSLFSVSGAIAISVAALVAIRVPIAVCRRDLHRLHGSSGNGHLDLLHRPDPHHGFREIGRAHV